MSVRTYFVPTISCDHCKRVIETEVAKLPGVDLVEVDIRDKTVSIKGEVSDEATRSAIEEAGYDVEGVAQ